MMKRKILSAILVAMICVFSIAAQNVDPSEKKAFVSNAYGEFSVESVRSMVDTFFAEISERKGSKGSVAIYGPLSELAERKLLMANQIRFRRQDPARFNNTFIGDAMELRTDLWVVPVGAEPPELDVKAYVAFEFGKIGKTRMKEVMVEFDAALSVGENSSGYIINYGTSKQIAQRERLIANSIRFRRYDPARIVMVSGGVSDNGVRTVMWIVPEGAEPPKP